jgi:N-terminal domain of toast_rack, DUF2154
MNTIQSSTPGDRASHQNKHANQQLTQAIRYISWAVNLIFLLALIWALYQAFVTGNQLPAWAWLGVVALFAAAVGSMVTYIVYRGVVEQVGPLDFRPAVKVVGELKSETQRIEAGEANSLHAEIKMIQGVMQLMGGTAELLEATFTYDNADWKPPSVQYRVDGSGQGNMRVEQRDTHRPAMRPGRCEWLIRLNEDLATDLSVKFGTGKADLHLGNLTLTGLRVESGVGALVVDLSGELQQNLEAFIKSGIGDTTLRLPQNAGVRLHSTVDFGSLQQHGLTWDGEAYTNAAYGKSPITLDIVIESGMGKVTLLTS